MQRRHGQPAAVDQRARERVVAGEAQRGVAEGPRGREPGCDEIGAARGIEDVLARRRAALAAITVEQRLGRLAGRDQGELPGKVVDIGDRAVAAARAERRHDVGGIAGEDHAAMDEALQHAAGKGVDAGPFVLPARLGTEHQAQPAIDVLGLLLLLGVGIAAELEVDAQHIVGLAVQQHRVGGMERRVEPETPLLGQFVEQPDVGDQELVVEDLAFERQAEHVAHGAAHAVAGDQPLGFQRIAAVRRFDLDRDVVVVRRDADDLVAEAHLDRGLGQAALVEEFLDVVLLQVHEGRELVAGLGLQVEAVDRPVA